MIDENSLGLLTRDAEDLLQQGWTPEEIVRLLRNHEEVSPWLEEEVALRRMSYMKNEVEQRLKMEKK